MPDPQDYPLDIDDRFIPVRAEDIASVLTNDVETFGEHASGLDEVAEAITLVVDQEVGTFEREMAHVYARFNPDRDTVLLPGTVPTGSDEEDNEFMAMLANLLWQANYEEMTEEQVVAAIDAANSHGLRIRLEPDRVSTLRVWVRGHGMTTRFRRPWRRPWRKEPVEVEVLKRLVVAVRMKDEPYLYLKMFKNIPISDLEALMPHARVKMGPRELAKLVAGGSGAVWTIAIKAAGALTVAASQLFYILALPFLGLTWKTFSGYRRAIKDRDSERTKHLYYQNLANNAAAIHVLATAVGQEEVKEALLAYALCVSHKLEDQSGTTDKRLDREAEGYLRAKFGVSVNFDMDDALETMDRLGLWQDKARLKVVPPEQAIAILEAHRRDRRSAGYHSGLIGRGPLTQRPAPVEA